MADAGVDVVAHQSGEIVQGPQTNTALQLASALQDTNQNLQPVIQAVGQQLKTTAEAKAHGAALKSSAAGFRDAVASGEVPAGSSMWFVQAFNQDRAQITSQQAAQSVAADSQSWEERSYNDGGVAFEQRMQKAMGDIHQQVSQVPGMHASDAEEGFQKGAAPIAAQAIASNNQYQLQQITLQKIQDNTTLMEQAITQGAATNPNATPAELLATIEPVLAKGKSIGFQDSELKQQAFNSILGAAYSANNGAGDPSLLKLAEQPFQGGPALSLIAGDDGKPYGEQLGYANYRIQQQQLAQANSETRQRTAQVASEGQKLRDILVGQYGLGAINQFADREKIQEVAKQNGISTEGVLNAASVMHREFEGLTGVTADFIHFNETDPKQITKVYDYHTEAATKGLTDGLIARMRNDVALGNISTQQADTVIAEGANANRTKFTENKADDRAAHQQMQDAKTHIADQVKQQVDGVVHIVESSGNQYFSDVKEGAGRSAAVARRINGAVGAVLLQNPNNTAGAQLAAQEEANKILNERRQAYHPKTAPALSPKVN